MTNLNLFILEFDNYNICVRDTMAYVMNRDHSIEDYQNKKKVLTDGLKENYCMSNFLNCNGERGEELREQFTAFVKKYYSEESTIIKQVGTSIEVDHSQNIKFFQDVFPVFESVTDITFFHIRIAEQQKYDVDSAVRDLVVQNDRMFRIAYFTLGCREYFKYFNEFNEVMIQNNGVPSSESNFLVQNYLKVLADLFRQVRSCTRFTDNETLDLLDDAIKVIEMTEGKRDRPDNKPFNEIFNAINQKLHEALKNADKTRNTIYESAKVFAVENP